MKRFLLLRILLAVFTMAFVSVKAQNLVNNPSFENVNSGSLQCSWYTTQAQFNSAINNWTCPTGGSSDIFVSSLAPACFCSPNSTNASAVGPQAPRTGTVMVGGSLWGNGGCSPYREYFQGSLSSPLVAGTQYKIEFYVSLADNSKNGCNNIGLKFSTAPVNVASMCVYAATPDVNYTGTPITDKVNWTKLEFCYTPTTSGLQYFMIGNFFSNVATATISVPGTNSGNAYYYLDDVSIQPSLSTPVTPTATAASTCSSTTMSLSALPAGVNYTWTAPAGGTILSGTNAQNATVQGNGVYTLTVQNPTACVTTPVTTTVLATAAASAASPTITGTGTITCATTTLALSSNTVAGATYAWTGPGIVSGAATPSIVLNAGGSYVVTITSGGCISSATTTIQQNITPPTIGLTPASTTISCSSPTVQLSAVLNPASASYTWTAPAGGALSNTSITNPVASGNGIFTLTATDPANGCVNSATASLVSSATTVTLSVASASICSGGSATLTVSGNANSYTWTPSATLNATTGTSVVANPGATTIYTVTGSAGGCTGSTVVTVTVVPVPVPVVTPASQLICQGQSATMSVSGAAAYTWSPAASLSSANTATVTASPTVTTVYSVLASASGCTATTQASVTVVSNPSVTVSGNTSICAGSSTALTAQGLSSYTWSPATGLSTTTGSIVTASPSTTTNYTVSGNLGTCTASTVVSITVNPVPTLTVSPTQTVCAGSSAQLVVSGATSYTWNPATYLSAVSGASVTSTPAASIVYTVTGASATCSSTITTSLVVNPVPVIAVSPSSPSLCAGGLTNMNASGAGSYTWSPATFLSSTVGVNVTASPTVSITYTVQGELASCLSQTLVTVTAVQPPVLSISPNATICSGTSTNLAVSGARVYSWSPMNGLTTSNGGANVVASPSSSSSYTVTGANASGCTGTISISVDVLPSPGIVVSASPSSICEGGSSALSATGASSYTWSPAATLSNSLGAAVSATPSSTSIYTVTGSNGTFPHICLATQTVEVVVTPTVSLIIPAVNPICFGETTQLQASGAMSYTWSPTTGLSSPNQAISNARPSVTTIYTVTAGNGSMCTSQGTLELVVNPLPQVYAGADTTVNVDEPVTLRGTGNVPVEFLPAAGTPLNCNFCSSITVNPQEKTCYTLRGTSSAGCVAYDEVCVMVTKDWNVYIPNAFTPNGDAGNDVFIPVGYGLSQIRLFIFDRWGTQIFAGDENNPGWDGKLKGKLCEQGVYVYQVELKTMSGSTIRKVGHVTLLGTSTK